MDPIPALELIPLDSNSCSLGYDSDSGFRRKWNHNTSSVIIPLKWA